MMKKSVKTLKEYGQVSLPAGENWTLDKNEWGRVHLGLKFHSLRSDPALRNLEIHRSRRRQLMCPFPQILISASAVIAAMIISREEGTDACSSFRLLCNFHPSPALLTPIPPVLLPSLATLPSNYPGTDLVFSSRFCFAALTPTLPSHHHDKKQAQMNNSTLRHTALAGQANVTIKLDHHRRLRELDRSHQSRKLLKALANSTLVPRFNKQLI
ncbi:hypothetical protein NM208_g14374 [Fusarium decemcellulare]|uniref:Uncharacterized protein n=1 Tax=Fusarium decemcellulare TaxID=57161 RepID=A0ACC1RGC5_9HYPO|nr:hypothetical protein NM208_g14374 [Fusarium decemcellulare]